MYEFREVPITPLEASNLKPLDLLEVETAADEIGIGIQDVLDQRAVEVTKVIGDLEPIRRDQYLVAEKATLPWRTRYELFRTRFEGTIDRLLESFLGSGENKHE